MKLGRLAKSLAVDVNVKRRSKGLLPRPVRFLDPFCLLLLIWCLLSHCCSDRAFHHCEIC